jgi:DNA-binding transcriptional LysR family regulator
VQVDRFSAITLHQLRVFAIVVEAGGFGPASEILALSQPTISDHVRSLERVLGMRLIERAPGRRRITVTPAGEVVVRTRAAVMAALEAGLRELDAVSAGEPGVTVSVSVGSGADLVSSVLTPLTRVFRASHPDIDVLLSVAPRPRNLRRVKQGTLDFALILGPVDDEQLIGESIASYDLALFGPPGHWLAGPQRAPLTALSEERFVVPWQRSLPRRVIEQVAERAGVRLHIVGQENRVAAQLRAVERGVGIAANGLHLLAPHVAAGRVCLLNVEEFPVAMDWFLVYRRGHLSPAPSAFREFLRGARRQIESDALWSTPVDR